MSISKALKMFKISYGTIWNKVNGKQGGKAGGQCYVSSTLEKIVVDSIEHLADWKVPFDTCDIRCLLKQYLERTGTVHKVFKNNMPGIDWVRGFIKRNQLTQSISDNVKAARAEVNQDLINNYFNELESSLDGIPATHIFNYDETNITDDPGAVRRGRKRVERKTQHSKFSISVMFAGSAAGEFLPPMVVYKSENVYENWVKNGPIGSIYDATKSGWFDMSTFDLWFSKQFLPVALQVPGRKVLIGDNLGSHFSVKVTEACKANDILFICLPPNSSHLWKPLDLAVFRALKVEWKDILDIWRRESKCKANLPKTVFPGFIYFKFLKTIM